MNGVSIVLPVYNERQTIEIVLREWQTMLRKLKVQYEFVVCEDGSTDGTSELLRKIRHKFSLNLNQSKKRRGYGGAVLAGIHSSKHDFVLCIDSDGQCDPKDFVQFWKSRNKANILIGWRTDRHDHVQRKIFSAIFKTAFCLMFPNPPHDPSAPFVMFKKKTVEPLYPLLSYLKEGFWWGFVGACMKKSLSINEFPVNHRERIAGDTVVYLPKKVPGIAVRNFIGLIKLRLA